MKRLWIGIGLMAVMLLSGIMVPEILDECHESVVEDLDRAADMAMAGQWDSALRLLDRAEDNWEEKRPVTASFTEHEPMDDIDGMFEQLEIYAAAKDPVSFGSTCVYLSSRLDALGNGHDFNLWNLF